jgi:hypothetical protein
MHFTLTVGLGAGDNSLCILGLFIMATKADSVVNNSPYMQSNA